MKKRRRKPPNTLKGRTFTQEEALKHLRSSTKPGFGVFSTNSGQLPQAKAWGLCEAYATGSLHKLNSFLQ